MREDGMGLKLLGGPGGWDEGAGPLSAEQASARAKARPAALPALPAYRADIDGLRAVAVMAVVLHHFWPAWLPGGYVGVDVFFVISGYLITQIMANEMGQERFSLLRFYERRARRIFPALFAVLGATWLAGYFLLLPSDYAASLRAGLATLLFSANLLFWRDSMGYFTASETLGNPLLHMWSLGVEEQFYVFFPGVLLLLLGWCKHRRAGAAAQAGRWLALLALLNLAAAAWVVQTNSSAAFYLSPLRGWELLAGAVLALGAVPQGRAGWWRELVAAAGLAAILAGCWLYSPGTRFPGPSALLPVLGAGALLWAGGRGASTWVTRALQWRLMTGLGLISYSLYLWHWPVLVMSRQMQDLQPNPAWNFPLLLGCVVLAAASYRWIEQPWRRPARATASGPARPLLLGLAALGLAGCHAMGVARQGFEQRVTPQVLALDKARLATHPLKACDGRLGGSGCVLGALDKPPDVLFWGDSHMLAWSPALSWALSQAGRSGVLAVRFACAPMLDVTLTQRRNCHLANEAVRQYLTDHPNIKTVVLAGYWRDYFRPSGAVRTEGDAGKPLRGSAAAEQGLHQTLAWLQRAVPQVILLGPVPVYEVSVPQLLALHQRDGRPVPTMPAAEQAHKHADFTDAVARLPKGRGWRYVDPVPWFCTVQCRLEAEGTAWYRDEQHLSVAGALAMAPALARGLALDSSRHR